ncbi:MAG: PKD domain-containing protein [Syntrophobacteraceae bacterium]
MRRYNGYLALILTVAFAVLIGSSSVALAAQAVLAWNASTDSSVTGYKVYYGSQSGTYQAPIDVGNNTTYTLTGLSASQTCYFAVTAYSSTQESPFSQEVACDFITAATDSNGQITPVGTTALTAGGSQTYTIVPNSGYQISALVIDGQQTSAAGSYTFSNLSGCHTISAVFVPVTTTVSAPVTTPVSTSYSISASGGSGGSISPSGTVNVAAGAAEAFTITPSANYQIASVTVDGASVGAVSQYSFNNVGANHTIAATFAASYTITATSQGSGQISPSGAVKVISGGSGQFAITPYSGYQISDVVVDGKSVGAVSSYSFTEVGGNHSIQAVFEAKQISIASSVQGSGTISPTGTNSFSTGTNVSYTMAPAKGYALKEVLVDGSAVTGGLQATSGTTSASTSAYTFSNVESNHTICAVYTPSCPVVADPGPDQNIKRGATVTLNGLNSTSSGSAIVSYKWHQISGPPVTLSNPSSAVCTFTPLPGIQFNAAAVTSSNTSSAVSTSTPVDDTTAVLFAFELTVTNSAGVSGSSSCLVNVSASGGGPMLSGGPDQTVSASSNVTLDGSSASDSYGTITSYTWTQTAGPTVSLNNANTATASFVAPAIGAQSVTLAFELIVQDQYGMEARGQWTVNVAGDSQPPVANAGANVTVNPMSTVELNGAGSSDPAGSSDTYLWTQLSGEPVSLSDPTSATPTFTASADPNQSPLVFMLTVTNGVDQLSATAQCTVTLKNTVPNFPSLRPSWSFASGGGGAQSN